MYTQVVEYSHYIFPNFISTSTNDCVQHWPCNYIAFSRDSLPNVPLLVPDTQMVLVVRFLARVRYHTMYFQGVCIDHHKTHCMFLCWLCKVWHHYLTPWFDTEKQDHRVYPSKIFTSTTSIPLTIQDITCEAPPITANILVVAHSICLYKLLRFHSQEMLLASLC